MSDGDALFKTTLPITLDRPSGSGRFYLLVVQGESSSMFHLPTTGTITIGRTPDSDLTLADGAASRHHAQIVTSEGAAQLHDLGSHNGTFVNGERIEGTRELASGDVIAIGQVTLVLHSEPRPERHPILDGAALRQRLGEEIERARRYQRPLALLVLALPGRARSDLLAAAVVSQLRLMDIVGWTNENQLAVVMPEVGADARETARILCGLVADVRVGLALCPDDACDGDTLLATARAAASAAQPGQIAAAGDAVREIQLSDRTILIADPAMVRLFDLIARLATSDLPILILGETGAGKEGAALAVHHGSPRARGPFVTLNCAAIPETLVESELFGHEKGAFTGALAAKPGKLEAADGGTLFLDEIGELTPGVQAKLLRALESKRVTRLGDVREREVDLRIVAATNRRLEEEVAAGRFRQDLFFRLGAATIVLPPLRDRPREIPILARRFLSEACARTGREPPALSSATMQKLLAHGWPGNVRELRNVVEYAAATVQEDVIEPWHLPDQITGGETEPAEEAGPTAADGARFRPLAEELRELERTRMLQALEAAGGVQRRAAELISMPLRTFVMKIKQYGISPRARRDA